MSEKKNKKSIEELCRSRLVRTAAGDMWPTLSQTSSHRLFRSPSPRASCSRSRRRTENLRHSLLASRPLSTEFVPGTSVHHSQLHDSEKRMKKPFFPGIHPQVVTHADPPFAGTDTQPLPPIKMPRGHEGSNSSKQGECEICYRGYAQRVKSHGLSTSGRCFATIL